MDSKFGVMDSNDITNSVDDWEVLESGGIDDNLSPVLFVLWVEGWINDLDGANESLAVDFVWEGSISDNTIEVDWVSCGEGCFVKLNVLVLYLGIIFRNRKTNLYLP